jgi:hypothetical protein
MIGVGLLLEDTAVDCGIAFSIGKNDMRNNRIFNLAAKRSVVSVGNEAIGSGLRPKLALRQ